MNNNAVYEWILHSSFAVGARAQTLERLAPHLTPLVNPGDAVLDLCCGTGFASFWFEAQGARVTGMDIAPYMLALAAEEARSRNSKVEFRQADIFTTDLGRGQYDLVSLFDSLSDFPPSDFAALGERIAAALKPGGRFVVQYHDGSADFMRGTAKREGVYQDSPERITFRFKEYLPEIGARVNTIRNETRGEEYDRIGYVYTVAIVQLAMRAALRLEGHVAVGENLFMDVFTRPEA